MNKKDLWKAQLLEYLHQCQIGISHLTCSNPNCPLVFHWGELEKKNSKKGKSALYKITQEQFVPVNLISYSLNDLDQVEDIEIQFKSGKKMRTKPSDYQKPTDPNQREIFLKSEEIVLFFNNSTKRPNLEDAEEIYLEDLWEIKEKIRWDQDKSKKKVFLFCENDPNEETQARKIDAGEKDYLFPIADFSTTNEIKNYEVYSPNKGTDERKQLWEDYTKEFSELRRVYGIRHLTSKKEDRQNNPEIELNEAQFIALERDKWRERNKSIKDAESKQFCQGEHQLTFGAWQERQEAELEQQQAIRKEIDSVKILEQKWEKEKGSNDEPKNKK